MGNVNPFAPLSQAVSTEYLYFVLQEDPRGVNSDGSVRVRFVHRCSYACCVRTSGKQSRAVRDTTWMLLRCESIGPFCAKAVSGCCWVKTWELVSPKYNINLKSSNTNLMPDIIFLIFKNIYHIYRFFMYSSHMFLGIFFLLYVLLASNYLGQIDPDFWTWNSLSRPRLTYILAFP